MNDIFLIRILVYLWANVLLCLYNSSKIMTYFNDDHSYYGIILYVMVAIAIYIKTRNIVPSLCAICAGILQVRAKSGFNDVAIIIKGNKLPYDRIKFIEAKKEEGQYRLTISFRTKPYTTVIKNEDKKLIYEIEKYYGKKVDIHD